MARVILFFACWAGFGFCSQRITLDADEAYVAVEVSHPVILKCCYKINGNYITPIWVIRSKSTNYTKPTPVNVTNDKAYFESPQENLKPCYMLALPKVTISETGFYQCLFNDSKLLYSHGTYLQVYKPMQKMIPLSESTKNKILMAEGILLLLCVVVPGTLLLQKTKRSSNLEKKKNKLEEENIYEGLDLEDCSSAYHQIQRSQVQGPYQDVGSLREDDIQLEKP